ncbi:MAG: hypothetical protein M3301_05095, partial [Chloroflexota bacterium]|nr:hypothetical protein [Chloroflexota bacterium]
MSSDDAIAHVPIGEPIQPAARHRSLRSQISDGNLGGYVLLAPAILVLLLLTIWPLIFSVAISFTDLKGGAGAETHLVGLANYRQVLADPLFT